MNRTALTCTALASLALLGSAWLAAGPLSPPVGPVASTYKTLAEVEPRVAINAANTPGDADSLFKIEKQGSYYLTGNVTGVVGKHGIEIVASGVTIDLNGFDLSGVPGMGAFGGVVTTVANLNDISIHNGTLRNWGVSGIDFIVFTATNCEVVNVRASGNGVHGIRSGNKSIVSGCTAHNNAAIGIIATEGSVVVQCTASSNGDDGYRLTSGSIATDCASHSNLGDGFDATNGSEVINCTARSNALDGIRVQIGSVVFGNNLSLNGDATGDGAGIHATGADNRIEGNNCTGADRGIDVDVAGNIIIRNTCSGNTIANWDIAANNVVGPILDRTAPGSAAILGNSAPDSTGSTHPNANFTY